MRKNKSKISSKIVFTLPHHHHPLVTVFFPSVLEYTLKMLIDAFLQGTKGQEGMSEQCLHKEQTVHPETPNKYIICINNIN